MSADRRQLVLSLPNPRRAWTVRVLGAACLLALLGRAEAQSCTVRLYWDDNPEPDITNYILVGGPATGDYRQTWVVPRVTTTEAQIPAEWNGVGFFTLRAQNAASQQSGYSNEVRASCGATVRLIPRALGNVVVVVVRRG